jgi:hypothetical protein
MGALSSMRPTLTYTIAKSTNRTEFLEFLKALDGTFTKGRTTIVLDNHGAHKGAAIKEMLAIGLDVLFLPPTW